MNMKKKSLQHTNAFMSLHSLLQDKLPPEKLLLLPKGFEVIGDIAVISIPSALEDEKYIIAEAFSSQERCQNSSEKATQNRRLGARSGF